jgi:hypothetical protein
MGQLKQQSTVICNAVKKAIEENDISSGNVTMPILLQELEKHHTNIIEYFRANNNGGLINNSNGCNTDDITSIPTVAELQENSINNRSFIYYHNGHYWCVPENFEFPKNPTLRTGWSYWLKGNMGYTVKVKGELQKAPLRPYRKFTNKLLPSKESNLFASHWKPIFSYMEKCPDIDIPRDIDNISADFVEESFIKATNYMKQRVSYIFKLKNRDLENWTISTWSKHISRGYVTKLGTEEDKIYLLPPNFKNKKRTIQQRLNLLPVQATAQTEAFRPVLQTNGINNNQVQQATVEVSFDDAVDTLLEAAARQE